MRKKQTSLQKIIEKVNTGAGMSRAEEISYMVKILKMDKAEAIRIIDLVELQKKHPFACID